jgi:uncharacterized protein with HEPN domain
VHAYFDVDLALVWEIVSVELLPLKAQLSVLAAESDIEEPTGGM